MRFSCERGLARAPRLTYLIMGRAGVKAVQKSPSSGRDDGQLKSTGTRSLVFGLQCGAIGTLGQQSLRKVEAFVKLSQLRCLAR